MDILNALIVIKQCLSRLLIKNCSKSTPKYGGRVSRLIGKEFGSESVDKVNTNFQGKKVPKKMHHTNVCDW